TLVVELVTNPVVQSGLRGVVDTLLTDFWGFDGVVTAFSEAAGALASGTQTPAEVGAALRANVAVIGAVGTAFGGAMTTFLDDRDLWIAVDGTLSAAVESLTTDDTVLSALETAVSDTISALGPIGAAVGPQVGAAVVQLVSDPFVSAGLLGVVDTLVADFFGAPGVVDAFSTAASQWALALLFTGKLSAANAAARQELRDSDAVASGVDLSLTVAVAEFLGDEQLWSSVDQILSNLVGEVLSDGPVQDAIEEQVATKVTDQTKGVLGDQLAAILGAKAGSAVLSLLTNPAVTGGLRSLVESVSTDFWSSTGVITAFSQAAGALASGALSGNPEQSPTAVAAALRANTEVQDAAQQTVTDAVAGLLADRKLWGAIGTALSSLVAGFVGDPAVDKALYDFVSSEVASSVGGDLGAAVGPPVATALVSLITNPAIGNALKTLADTIATDFFGATGVISTLADAAGKLAAAAVAGDFKSVLPQVTEMVRMDADIDAAVDLSVSAGFSQLFGDSAFTQAVGGTVATLVTSLLIDPVVQQAAGAAVADLVTGYLGKSPIAGPAGQAAGKAVQQFLATAGVASGIGTAIGSLMPDFLGQPGVSEALGGVAGQLAVALVRGDSLKGAVKQAVSELKTNADVVAAVKALVADTLNLVDTRILGNPAVQQSLGAITTTLITDLAGDPAVQALVAEKYGPVVAGLLTDTAVVNQVASALGSAVTQLLAYPGVSAAITQALEIFADDVLENGWKTRYQALGQALAWLRADPPFVDAVSTVIPTALNSILANPAVIQAVGVVVKQEVQNRLEALGIKNKFLDRAISQVAEGTVDAFLKKPAAISLLDSLTVKILLGMPLSDAAKYVGHEIVYSTKLQIALGSAIGQGIGSLFGDNIFGRSIGLVAGLPITITISATAGFLRVYNWLSGGWAVTPIGGQSQSTFAAQAAPAGGLFQPAPAASDLYEISAVVPDAANARRYRDALTGDGRFTLTHLGVTEPDADQPGSVDLTIAVDADGPEAARTADAPMIVAFRFPLDRLLGLAELPAVAVADPRKAPQAS
ncbi:MAG: hypothetical protein ACKOQ4_04790, partial [Mycobacterium sp.]